MKKFLFVLIIIPVLIWGIWAVIPESSLQEHIEGSINSENLSLEAKGLNKKLFYMFTIDRLTLKGFGREQFYIQDIQAPIDLLSLLSFQLNVPFEGYIGEGKISGNVIQTIKGKKTEITFHKVPVNTVPFMKHAGIKGPGTISGNISILNNKGHIEFLTNNVHLNPLSLSGNVVPLNFFNNVRGALDINGDAIFISSIALEGKDIYARLKGKINNNLLDLSMEIMPGSSFLDNPLFINSMGKYEVSPGYYVIHMKRDLRYLMGS